jgi:hypothetical protein
MTAVATAQQWITIDLNRDDLRWAVRVTEAKQHQAKQWKFKLEEGRTDDASETTRIGTLAELAVARFLGVPHHALAGALDTKRGDVDGEQVKSVRKRHLSLIVREHDPPRFRYVLAIVEEPQVRLVGWIEGDRAKRQRFFRPKGSAPGIHRSAYFVPQAELRPMDELLSVRLREKSPAPSA